MHPWILFVLVGIVAGWLAGVLTQGRGFGLLGDLVVGVLGALVGGLLFSLVGLTSYGTLGAIVTSTVGAVVLLWILRIGCRRCR